MQDAYSLAAAMTLLLRERSSESEKCANEKSDYLETAIEIVEPFPTEVFYWGEEQCGMEDKRESNLISDDTQTQRIASPEILAPKVSSRKPSEQKKEQLSLWVRRSTRRQKTVKEASDSDPKKKTEKAFKVLKNCGKTTVVSQKQSWESIQRETWNWMNAISKKKEISRKQLESYFLMSFEVIRKSLSSYHARSPEVHAQMVRFVVDFTKLFDVAHVCKLKTVFGYIFRLFNDVLTKFMKKPSIMNETNTAWIQAKSVFTIILSTTVRTPVLHALAKAVTEIQLYFMSQISTSSNYESHINYVLSQFTELNQTVTNRLKQLQNHQQFGIGV